MTDETPTNRPNNQLHDRQLSLTFYTPASRADGSVMLTPQTPGARVTLREAMQRLGLSAYSVRQLIHQGCLQSERPTPHKTYILAESLEAYIRNKTAF
jgi:hypothetical protein